MEIVSCPTVGRLSPFLGDRSDTGWSLYYLQKEFKTMTQSELNQQIAKQTGESMTEIVRRGFTILAALPDADDDEPSQQTKPTAA